MWDTPCSIYLWLVSSGMADRRYGNRVETWAVCFWCHTAPGTLHIPASPYRHQQPVKHASLAWIQVARVACGLLGFDAVCMEIGITLNTFITLTHVYIHAKCD